MASTPQDALAVLKKDHATVKQLFGRFEALGDGADKSKRAVVDRILVELAVHATIEEQVFYPAIRQRIGKLEDDVLEGLEEHHLVKLAASELEKLQPANERFDAKMAVLMENVRHHIQEEEGELFPEVRKAFSRGELQAMGDQLLAARQMAPTRAHPHAPDTPPANAVVGFFAKPMDAALRTGKHAVERSVVAAADAAGKARRAVRNR